jgi:myo-inositol 2-dehydrogenase/D-chiro-inositol 1-dehydrogenase
VGVKIGFVGSGSISQAHMSALEKVEDAQIVAFTDTDEERAVQAAARYPGAGAYTDLAKMLDEQQLDTVYVCVPPHAHGEIELTLIERGIPFFVEKPIGNDRETPSRILAALKGSGLLTSVGYMARYHATVEQLREHLKQDEPVLAWGSWLGGVPGVYWWRRKDMGGGQILEQTTHIFDVARYLFGEVVSVFCAGRKGLITDIEDYNVEDASVCTLTFESGLICEISSSCAVTCGSRQSVEVICRNSYLELRGSIPQWSLGIEQPGRKCEIEGADDVFLLEDRAWIDAVQSGDGSKIRSPYEDACKTHMVTCAANESIASGNPESP